MLHAKEQSMYDDIVKTFLLQLLLDKHMNLYAHESEVIIYWS